MFESMPGIDGEVIDVDNYIAAFNLISDKQMNMMNQYTGY